jgi:uncharacterized protein YecE (DUF72 family)
LTHYARRFDTVECDATFYGIPAPTTVDNWRARTPEGFLLSSKIPREISHDRGLVDCRDSLGEFLGVMSRLGDRLGPVVAQFPYVAKGRDPDEYATGDDFRSRLAAFLDLWPGELRLAVEVRNARWIGPPLLDLLRGRHVSLVLSAYYTMPAPDRLFRGPDPFTADWSYVRFLGDHRKMDDLVARLRREGRRSAEWDSLAVDREDEMRRWARHLRRRAEDGGEVLAYFNNHYAGFAPASADLFLRIWEEVGRDLDSPDGKG